MEPDRFAAVKEINGINLANYFPHQRAFNSVVYVHKRFLEKPEGKAIAKKEKIKKKCDENKKKDKRDQSQQYNNENPYPINSKKHNTGLHHDSVLEHTIRFAKNIVPLVIPPSKENHSSPVFYTIKTFEKPKNKTKKSCASNCEHVQNVTHKKGKSKEVIETYRKEKFRRHRESISVRESVSHSSQSTMDDINMHQSLSCTLSEVSERKCNRKEINSIRKNVDTQKFVVSESFEALATELNRSGDTKIKIHLMNDKDKTLLSENLRIPILNAVKDCISELKSDQTNEVKNVQRYINFNTQKLDNILYKLTCIENKLDAYAEGKNKSVLSPKNQTIKTSKLEQLSEDLIEDREELSLVEELSQELFDKRRDTSAVVEFIYNEEEKIEDLGCGEIPGRQIAASSVGDKTDHPNRIPARFCWTDASRRN